MKKILISTLCLSAFLAASAYAMDAKDLREGYALSNKYCTGCHESVADPEKPGHTRDTWHLILNIMHQRGMEKLSAEDTAKLVDYFYAIRQGMERQPG